jgi:hypothetical protein
MANYIVSYDLNGAYPTHKQIDEHMAKSGWTRGRILETVWYVATDRSASDIFKYVNAILSSNDRLIVAKADSASFRNLLINNDSLKNAWSGN